MIGEEHGKHCITKKAMNVKGDERCGDKSRSTALLCDGLLFGGDCDVPEHVAKCPECGGTLHAENQEWDSESGAPTLGGLIVYCNSDPFFSKHMGQYHDWIPVQLKCADHFNAVDN